MTQHLSLPPPPSRLLLVDDQPTTIRSLHSLFCDEHQVFMATNGRMAIEICKRELPDLVLLDMEMPDMHGIEVCRELKSSMETRDIPIIFVTGNADPIDETEGLNVGAVDFVSKPFCPAVVRARVKTHLTLKAQADRLRELTLMDGLTGVRNRRGFDQSLDFEWRACQRNRAPLGVLLIDIDHFKHLNDRYGHPAGDEALRVITHRLGAGLRRPRDVLCRYGGEEFACLLAETDGRALRRAADYLRRQIEREPVQLSEHESVAVTVSIGAASMVPTPDNSPSVLVRLADQNLYEAKKRGRNRIHPELGHRTRPIES